MGRGVVPTVTTAQLLQVDDVQVTVEDTRPLAAGSRIPDAGGANDPCIVVLPPAATTPSMVQPLCQELAAQTGMRVIALGLPGHPGSTLGRHQTLEQQRDTLLAATHQLGVTSMYLIGDSEGAAVSLLAGLPRPDATFPGPAVRGIYASDPVGCGPRLSWLYERSAWLFAHIGLALVPSLAIKVFATIVGLGDTDPDTLKELWSQPDLLHDVEAIARDARRSPRHVLDAAERAGGIDPAIPTTVTYGQYDVAYVYSPDHPMLHLGGAETLWAPLMDRIAGQLGKGVVGHVIPGGLHCGQMADPFGTASRAILALGLRTRRLPEVSDVAQLG